MRYSSAKAAEILSELDRLREKVVNAAEDAHVGRRLHKASSYMSEVAKSSAPVVRDHYHLVEGQVRRHPTSAVLVALALGALATALWNTSSKP